MICIGIYEVHTPSVRLSRFATHVETGRPRKSIGSIHAGGRAVCKTAGILRIGSAAAQDARLVAIPVALLLGGALVVLLLALGESDLELGAAILPVQVERHQRVALALDAADESRQLRFVEQ